MPEVSRVFFQLVVALTDAPHARPVLVDVLRQLSSLLTAGDTNHLSKDERADRLSLAAGFAGFNARIGSSSDTRPATLHQETVRLHEELVRGALERSRNNVARAARELGISRNRVYSITRAAGSHRR